MTLKDGVAKQLYKAISSGKIGFHRALKVYKPVDSISSRGKVGSSRLMSSEVIEHLKAATAPGAFSAWTSVLFPTEILYLCGIYPMTLEVLGGTFSTLGLAGPFLDLADADDVPVTMCSFHRILVGLSKTDFIGKPLIVGATSTMCDGNVKSFAEAAREQGVPFVFIDVPFEVSDDSINYVKEQLEHKLEMLTDLTKTKVTKEKLASLVENSNKFFDLARRYYALSRESNKNIFMGHEIVNFAFPMHFLLGSDKLAKILDAKCNDVEKGAKRNQFYKTSTLAGDTKKIMWLHIVPQYRSGLWEIIDDGIRAKIVCDEYSTPYFEDYDPNDPLASIAKRLISHPSNGPIERRIAHILKAAEDFKVDGIVHYSSWGCHQASGNAQILAGKIQEAGYKFLNLNGDAADEKNSSFEQHRTRLEAFLEH